MKRNTLSIILVLLLAVLVVEACVVSTGVFGRKGEAAMLSGDPGAPAGPSQPGPTPSDPQPGDATDPVQTIPTDPSEPVQPPVPEQTSFLLTFTGDSTLGCTPAMLVNSYGFTQVVGEDYGFPYRNVLAYFENDDLTLTNLESVFADDGVVVPKEFNFRAPVQYVQVLTSSSVEAVTLANNHSMDFGQAGYDSTKATLEENGITYVEQNRSVIYTTQGGLVVGLYGAAFSRDDQNMKSEIAALREQGAQVIVAAVHWGEEGAYRPNAVQKNWGHALIDAGVDIVWGNHPHTLQPIEKYKDGVIYYSLGNFSFGGNTWLQDPNTAIVQQEVILQPDGTATLGELTIIPCAVTSTNTPLNNYQPTPYEEGSPEYNRVLSKLDGTYTGPDLVVNYNQNG